jgi:hypothetical protein
MRDGRLTTAMVAKIQGQESYSPPCDCSITLIPSSRMESLVKEGQEDTGCENHPTRSYSAVARRARAVAFYSLQQRGSPGSATGHL